MNSYFVGQTVRCYVSFYANGDQTTGALTDPTTVNFKLLDGANVETDYAWPSATQIVRDGIGQFHVDVVTTKAGSHTYRFTGTGTLVAACEHDFFVQPSRFASS